MFDLDQAMAEWRRQMLAGGIETPVPLEELESHLCEDVAQQIRSGASPEQAFSVAVERIGGAGELKREFEKVQDPVERKRKRLWSFIAGEVLVYSSVFVTWLIFRRLGKIGISGGKFLVVLASVPVAIALGWIGQYVAKSLPVILNEWLRTAIILMAIFLGVGLLRLIWNYLPLNSLVQAQIVLLWTLAPLPGFGLCAAEWCDNCAARRRMRAPGV
jgi:hypothetical protein